jgi:hypothetical protein
MHADLQDGGLDGATEAMCMWDCVRVSGMWCSVVVGFERDESGWSMTTERDYCQPPDEPICRWL